MKGKIKIKLREFELQHKSLLLGEFLIHFNTTAHLTVFVFGSITFPRASW